MDLDAKVLNFTKKALWKQVEGYKGLLAQKEIDLAKCFQDRIQAERTAKTTELILSKISSSLSQFDSDKHSYIHESLVPLNNLLDDVNLDQEFSQTVLTFLQCISHIIISKQNNIIFRELEPATESRKDLVMSELELSVEEKNQKISLLENKIFSLEKRLAVLQQSKTPSLASTDSPSKRPRTDSSSAIESSSSVPNFASENDQNIVTKLTVLTTELEELKKVCSSRTSELDVMFAENQKLKTELKSKSDQINRIPPEFLKDGASVRQLTDDLKRLKNDLTDAVSTIKLLEKESNDSSYRHNKILTQLSNEVKEKYTKLEDFIKSTDLEISRIRKDRDHMRQLYEHTNGLLASCQKQISNYQTNINISETAIKSLTETIGKLKSHISTIPGLQDNTTNLSKILDDLRADEQVYVEELENMGRAFEQIQSENAIFIKKIMEKDEIITKLLGEKMKAEFVTSQIQKETESSLQRAHKIEEVCKHRVSEIEAREDTLLRQVSSLEKDLKDRIVAADGYKSRLSEANAEVSHLRSKIDRLSSELNDMKSLIPSTDIKSEFSYEKRRLTEELSVAKKKLEAYAASGVGLVKELEEELIIYKKLMKCNSCHTRDKNAVILKCMHCFCKNCLDIRLETRQRKCPNCGDPFGASDVKQIYL